MAHYAIIDNNNIVIFVHPGKNENEDGVDWEQYYNAIRTSYNTHGGVHYNPETGLPSEDQSKSLRKNYAGIGYYYDSIRDAFIPPKPFESWILNDETCLWNSPIPKPETAGQWQWDEDSLSWIIVDVP